jgi:hypothetical protein
LHRKVTHNHSLASIDDLVAAVEQLSGYLTAHPAQVLSVIGNSQ